MPAVVVFPRPTFALLRFGARKVMPETHLHLGCSDLVIACLSRDVYASNHIVTASLGLLLGGCYEVDKPIITRDIAIEVPGLNGDVLSSNGDTIVFSFDGRSMSYQGGERQTDGSIEWEPCSFLVMSLRNDFYWFQCGPETKGDGQEAHALWLFKFESRVRQLSGPYRPVMTEDEFRQFASQHRVTVSENKPHRSGSRGLFSLTGMFSARTATRSSSRSTGAP